MTTLKDATLGVNPDDPNPAAAGAAPAAPEPRPRNPGRLIFNLGLTWGVVASVLSMAAFAFGPGTTDPDYAQHVGELSVTAYVVALAVLLIGAFFERRGPRERQSVESN